MYMIEVVMLLQITGLEYLKGKTNNHGTKTENMCEYIGSPNAVGE
jgi:hypothetical protein